MHSRKTVAITGASGFLGRNCVRKATEMGIATKGIVRRPEAADLVEGLGAEPVLVKQMNKQELTKAFKGCDGILHFIGVVNERYGNFQEINVRGTLLSLESAYESQVSRFVVPSGLGVDQYGKKTWATNGYFASKKQIEEICRSNPTPFVIFRPSYILGPGDELLPNLVESILKGTVFVVEEGNTPFQPIFVEDATTAFLRAATGSGKENTVYDLVGPEIFTFIRLIEVVTNILHCEGFNIPNYTITKIPIDRAAEVLEMSKEEVDVMLCDVLGDPTSFTRDFQVSLTPIRQALLTTVRAIKKSV